jgi:hypothetical protein
MAELNPQTAEPSVLEYELSRPTACNCVGNCTEEMWRSLPKPTGCTFTDEMWRTQTLHPERSISYSRNGPPCPEKVRPLAHPYPPDPPARTAAERACAEDLDLWESSLTLDDYEERKRVLYEKRRLEREEWLQKQPAFYKFPYLPTELRHHIWRLALEEPTTVRFTVSKYTITANMSGRCRRRGYRPAEFAVTACLPPLMLVNYESHQIASAHYQRAFRGVRGGGGVLAAYPTVLHVDESSLKLLQPGDLQLVQELTLKMTGSCSRIGCKQLRMILRAPNLRRLVVEAWDIVGGPSQLRAAIRNSFLEPTSPVLQGSDENVPEVEVELEIRYTGGAEVLYHFRGSILDLPNCTCPRTEPVARIAQTALRTI